MPLGRSGQFCDRRSCRAGLRDQPRRVDEFEITVEAPGEPATPWRSNDTLLALLAKLTARRPRTVEEACDALDVSPKRLRELVALAGEKNLAVRIEGGAVGIPRQTPDIVQETGIAPVVGSPFSVACISDTHLGSKYCLRAQLKDFIEHAYSLGVRVILHSGDILDGDYRHGKFEMSHMGIEEQMRDLAETLPVLPGLTYHGIDGNHDFTFTEESGVDVSRTIAAYFHDHGRNDFYGYGARGAMLRVGGALVDLWHPSGSGSYAVSYGLQKKVESYAPGFKPHILQVGHWHRMATIDERGIFAFAAGTFQGYGSGFSRSLNTPPPAIGGTILTWQLTADGTMRDLVYRTRRYFQSEQPLAVGAVAR
jgi:predicted phosphodiesterase